MSCTGPCTTGAFAEVSIGRTKRFSVGSHVVNLSTAGSRTVSLGFSKKQLGALKAGRKAHKRITATVRGVLLDSAVYGVIHDPTGSIAQQTGGKSLTITG